MSDHTTLDVCGSFWTSTTFLYHFGAEKKDSPEYNTNAKFFSNKGASMLIRKAVIDDIGLFDEDFWCYYEETDFCNRAWLSGYECVYLPKATAYHANGGSSLLFANDFIQFHNFKNKIMSMVKNFEISTLILRLPQHIFIIISISIYWLITGKVRHFTAIHKALLWNMINIKSTLKKRRVVQKFRTVSDTFIFSKVQRNPKFSYYTALLRNELKKYSDTEF
jgi:GT2 family glycosyltransferase